jgi:hypothetical protein
VGWKGGHATWAHLGLGGRLTLFFNARLYILKNLFPKGAEFYEVQNAVGITIFVFGGYRIPITATISIHHVLVLHHHV